MGWQEVMRKAVGGGGVLIGIVSGSAVARVKDVL